MAKPIATFFDKFVAVSRHEQHEIAYVGVTGSTTTSRQQRQAGLVTVWVRRDRGGFILRHKELLIAGQLPKGDCSTR